MRLRQWADKRIDALNVWDIGVLKVCMVLIGIIIGAYIPSFVQQSIGWFAGVGALLLVWLMVRFFSSINGK